MIAFLIGRLAKKSSDEAIINCHGVGYQVGISTNTFSQLPAPGEEIKLLTYHHITENEQRLFGFYSDDEKRLFQLLITVKSIGPKLGLAILSGMEPDEIIQAIQQSNHKMLSSISGVGKKTAERLVLELKDKIDDISPEQMQPEMPAGGKSALTDEVISGLEALGYANRDATRAAIAAQKDNRDIQSVQALLKKALQYMNR